MTEALLSERGRALRPSAVRDALTGVPPELFLAGGLPPPEAFPYPDLATAAAALLDGRDALALQYAPTEGDGDLRRCLAGRLSAERRGPVAVERVVVTTGSQQALDLLARVLIDPGDALVVESPTYVGALRAFAPWAPGSCRSPSTATGWTPHSSRANWPPGSVRSCATSSPTSRIPAERRSPRSGAVHLGELADRYRFVVVEDDPYGQLRFRGRHLAPIVYGAPGDVAYLGSVSKVIAPGLRVGYAELPEWLVRPFVLAKQAADLNTSSLAQRLALRLLERPGWLDRHLTVIRRLYLERASALCAAVTRCLEGRLTVNCPEGGMFAWGSIAAPGVDSASLVAAARRYGVALVGGDQFSFDGTGFDRSVRLSFSMLPPDRLDEAVARLVTVFDGLLPSRAWPAGPRGPAGARAGRRSGIPDEPLGRGDEAGVAQQRLELGREALERRDGGSGRRRRARADQPVDGRRRLFPRAVEGAQGDEAASALLDVERGEAVDEHDERARGPLRRPSVSGHGRATPYGLAGSVAASTTTPGPWAAPGTPAGGRPRREAANWAPPSPVTK